MDFPLLAFQSIAKVTNLALFGGGGSLDIHGRDFSGASAILINGYKAPVFVVLSDTRILADIPSAQLGAPIQSVSVLRRTVSNSEDTVVSFEALVPSPAVTTSTYLVQKVLKNLLTTPGSDLFSQQSGGGLLSLLGAIPADTGGVYSLVALRVRNVVEEITALQTEDIGSDPDERLSFVEVIDAAYSEKDTSLDVRLRIVASSGVSVLAGVAL